MNANNNIYTKLTKCFILGLTSFLVTHEAGAGDGISSAEIVGYATAKTQKNGLTVGACFIPTTGKKIDLTDLKVAGYDAETGTEAELYVQTLDEFGRTVATYTYYDVPGEVTGWYDGNDNEVAKGAVTIQPGEGLWSMSTRDGMGIQSAGVVPFSDVAVILQKYGLSVANPTPVPVDLTKIDISGYDAEAGSEADVYVQTLDEFGRTVATYTYYDVPGELMGWFDGNDNEVAAGDVVLQPGEGLWTMSAADGFMLVFPAVQQ